MIYKYKIKNFLSILQEESINFKASPLKQHNDHLINNKVLPIISFYGPNGGGKSTIIYSFNFLCNFVLNNRDTYVILKYIKNLKNYESKNKPIDWSIEFIDLKNKIYKYSLSIDDDHIVYEKLSTSTLNSKKDKNIFERKKQKIVNACEQIQKTNIKINNTFYGSYLFFLDNILNIDDIKFVVSEFRKMIFVNSDAPVKIINSPYGSIWNYNIDLDLLKNKRKEILKIINDFNLNIVDIEVFKDINGYFCNVTKKDSWNKKHKIPLYYESAGTLRFMQLFLFFLKNIHNDSYFFIDEIDKSLHTKLLKYIYLYFLKNKTHSQLICTSHDMPTLSNDIFRKDEIYFIAINELFFTNIVCLNDFDLQIRESNSFYKKYLDGKFGYDPYIDYGLEWLNNEEKEKH